jgi:hypothetical protein
MKNLKILGIILLVAGAGVLIYGIFQFVEIRQSLGGKISGLFGQRDDGDIQAIIMMIAGGIAALGGFFITTRR